MASRELASSAKHRDVPENARSSFSGDCICSSLPQRIPFSEKNILVDPSATRIAFSESAMASTEKNILLDSHHSHPLSPSFPHLLRETGAPSPSPPPPPPPPHLYRHSHPSPSDLCNAKLYSEPLFLSPERESAATLGHHPCPSDDAFLIKKQAFMEASPGNTGSIVLQNDNDEYGGARSNEEQRVRKPFSENQWDLLCSEMITVDNLTTLCLNEDFSLQQQQQLMMMMMKKNISIQSKKQAFMEPSSQEGEDSVFSPVQEEDEDLDNAMHGGRSFEKPLPEKSCKLQDDDREATESSDSDESEEEEEGVEEYRLETEGNLNVHSSFRARECFVDSVATGKRHLRNGSGDGREDASESNVATLKPQVSSRASSKESPKDSSRHSPKESPRDYSLDSSEESRRESCRAAPGDSLQDSLAQNPADREQRFKQIIHWLQIEAKSQAESIFRLSEELSWQEAAFLDLQEQRLADLGIDLRSVKRELSSSTQVS